MSDNVKSKKPVKSVVFSKRKDDLTELETFLANMNLEVKGSVHVNGSSYPHCILTVDFGEPLNLPEISEEDQEKLQTIMVLTTKNILGRNERVRVNNDPVTNIFWTSIPQHY